MDEGEGVDKRDNDRQWVRNRQTGTRTVGEGQNRQLDKQTVT